MAGNKIVVIERMNKRSPTPENDRLIERLPRDLVGTGMIFAPSAFIRSSLDCGAVSTTTTVHGTPAALGRVGNALAGISRADCPNALFAISL